MYLSLRKFWWLIGGLVLEFRHAGRSTITTDDVLLLVRRNEELEGLLREFIEEEKMKKGESAGTVAAAGKRKR